MQYVKQNTEKRSFITQKIHKLTSLFLALVLSLALAVPCFAAAPVSAAGEPQTIISLEGKKVGDKLTVGDMVIEIIDDEAVMARLRYIIQNRVYTQQASDSFVWISGNNPTLNFRIDCATSGCTVHFRGELLGGATVITDTVAAGTSRSFSVTNQRPDIDYYNVTTTLTPQGENMRAVYSVYES